MKDYQITSETTNTDYEFRNESVIVQGSFVKDTAKGTLQSISGSCFLNNNGEVGRFLGSFNGYPREEGIKYTLSEIASQDAILASTAMADVEKEALQVSE